MSRNLEPRIVAALRGGLSAAKLAALADETEVAIRQAEANAAAQRQRSLDPLSSPDARQARAAMEDAAFRSERLRSLLPRLQARYGHVVTDEERAEWEARYQPLKRERDVLAEELAEIYPQAVAKLMDLFSRIAANDAKIQQLHLARPSGVALHLVGAELKARDLHGFNTANPSIANDLRLPCWQDSSQSAWPPTQVPLAVLAATSASSPHAGPNWFENKQAKAIAARADAVRVARHYAEAHRERQERENRRR